MRRSLGIMSGAFALRSRGLFGMDTWFFENWLFWMK
jgi:hypothetical protein